nr:immunoglobulin heavy chain junction region [Macaca mulatta]MOV86622.1 immunoglobulin heavy chain junction region [Macaca mulatta]MOV86749.1 immunoglobulin heavy chain junction region [Macaca mulatta]MOV86915.1 immunoglobulin heavy chain junction region [Macaca mulatta]MOV87208.1 immunoglobulin heavy chain junction region [Macaca mulatta]
CARRDETYDYW